MGFERARVGAVGGADREGKHFFFCEWHTTLQAVLYCIVKRKMREQNNVVAKIVYETENKTIFL